MQRTAKTRKRLRIDSALSSARPEVLPRSSSRASITLSLKLYIYVYMFVYI